MFRARTSPEAIDLVSRLLEYTPSARITPLQVHGRICFTQDLFPHDLFSPGVRAHLLRRAARAGDQTAERPRAAGALQLHRAGQDLFWFAKIIYLFYRIYFKTYLFPQELKIQPSLNPQLVPVHLQV